MSQFTHKVQKYALIHSAASEILAHMEELKDCPEKYIEFHALQIEKAAMFIQFVEDVCIIPGSEELHDWQMQDMWNLVQDPSSEYHYGPECNAALWKPIISKMKDYQSRINGKFLNITAPF